MKAARRRSLGPEQEKICFNHTGGHTSCERATGKVSLYLQLGCDLTGVFCTSGSEREFTLEERWYADEEIQAGADRNAATTD